MKKIYVDQEAIKVNERTGEQSCAPIIIEALFFPNLVHTQKVFSLEILGPSRVVYEPKANGPRVWIETESPLNTN